MPPETTTQPGQHLILYDGTCGLCHRFVRFVVARDRYGQFHFSALQEPGASRILRRHDVDPSDTDSSFVVARWTTGEESVFDKSTAGLFVLTNLGWPWKLLGILSIFPTAVLDWGYDRIARSRHRFFGEATGCPVPDPALLPRFRSLTGDEIPGGRIP